MVIDDVGRTVSLAKPSCRVISLAPDITELLFAAGAGACIVGSSDFSDYPVEARQITRVGGYGRMDIEKVLSLQPDVVIAWHSGSNQRQLRLLDQLAIPVYQAEPRQLIDIATTLRRLGVLTGTEAVAEQAANQFEQQIMNLRQPFSGLPAFYQIWHRPVITINSTHLLSDVMGYCGATNVFAHLPNLTPTISREAVLAANPSIIIASGPQGEERPAWLDEWQKWPWPAGGIALVTIPPEWIQRHNPRIIQGAARLCRAVARATLPSPPTPSPTGGEGEHGVRQTE
ncbi:MAG: cobalamin-binding protein [Magnetococcales bacterium]|nr:cobalamin-binding protein [Magnetococcales bacterium]